MSSQIPKIVAIDGPAGSGKSSICAKACKQLGWSYINTGSLYRAVAVIACRKYVDHSDPEQVKELLEDFKKNMKWDSRGQTIFYKGEDLTPDLHTRETTAASSLFAKDNQVRAELLPLQRLLAETQSAGILVDGRDIGTVVFPDADLKIFMTASIEERARRRLNQILEANSRKGATTENKIDDISKELEMRDAQDIARGNAPLKQADDAIIFDNSALGVEEAVEALIILLKNKSLI